MFILGTICCRGGSKGVPEKNIRLLNGKPLIAYTIETAQDCAQLNDIIISTDSNKIAAIAKQFGAKVPFMRTPELATDAASKWAVFIHAVETYQQQTNIMIDYLVDMDVTVPLKISADIDGAIQFALQNKETDVVISCYEAERNPYFNMMEIDNDGFAKIVKQSSKPIVRRQDAPKVYSLTPAVYVIKKSALYTYEHWSKAKCKLFEVPRKRAVDIDTEIDFRFVEFLINKKNA
ncbi:MAG: cytidylyltransferase domain-containing protein [Chitinophagaceae bacterium]